MGLWWKEGVVYQIYPRSFLDSNGDGIGDLRGIISKAKYIKDLGADIVWLSPIFSSPNDDNGYDISDYRDIMTEFGTMADFDELLDVFHSHGLKVVLDLVVNHTSDEHFWFRESRKGKNNKYRDYYIWRDDKGGKPFNNWTSFFGGSAWRHDEGAGGQYLHCFSPKQVDLNWDNPEVRSEVKDIMRFWLDKGVDGFRCDVINLISKAEGLPDGAKNKGVIGMEHIADGPRVHEYIHELYKDVLSKYDCFTVGEIPGAVENALKYVLPEREELNMIIQFDHVNADCKGDVKWYPRKFNLRKYKEAWAQWMNTGGWVALYLENHDQPRSVSRFGDEKKFRVLSAKMLAISLYFLKGTPFVYQGQEIGMTNAHMKSLSDYNDVETHTVYKIARRKGMPKFEIMRRIKRSSRDNARTPMQWNSTLRGGFTTGKPWMRVNRNTDRINVADSLRDKDSILYFFRKLFEVRRQYKAALSGDFTLLDGKNRNAFCYTRKEGEQTILVACNFSKRRKIASPGIDLQDFRQILGNYGETALCDKLVLRPYEAAVFVKEEG